MNTTDRPCVLILSRQDVRDVNTLNCEQVVDGVKKGGYITFGNLAETPEIVLVGNGSDVGILISVAETLSSDGVKVRVVSVPSIGLLLDQGYDYLRSLIPENVKSFGLTSGLPSVLYPVMSRDNEILGLDRFGASAPYKVLEDKFGFNKEEILAKIQLFLGRKR